MSKFYCIIAVAVIAIMLILAAPAPSLLALDRYSGNDRYATAVEICKSGWENGSDVVILCRGDVYADALAGVPLAYANDAPVLLTQPNSLPAVTKDEIGRLGATKVYILGGSAAVSLDVEAEIKTLGVEVARIGGSDRFATAAAIAEIVAPEGAETVFLAYGPNFPDALAAASYAAISGSPVLLTGTNELPQETVAALAALQPTKVFVVGGTAVISDAVFSELQNAERVYGADRYGTAVALAERFIPEATSMYVATGLDTSGGADAITGAALAAKEGTGILLVGNYLPSVVGEFLGKGIQDAVVLGGGSAISSGVAQAIEDALYTRGNIDEIISGGITDVNFAISNNGDYAELSPLDIATGTVSVGIKNGSIQVTEVYTDIVQILIDALNANKDQVASIAAGTCTIDLTGEAISAEAIKAFVKGSGLKGSGADGAIMGYDPISMLVGQTLSATVTDIDGNTYVYSVAFQTYVGKDSIDEIISGSIIDVNTAITANGDYAALSALDSATGTVRVSIKNGSTQVTEVYTDIVQILIDALNANNDKVAAISAGSGNIDLTGEAISAEDIKAFVKGSGLKGSGADGEILGSDPISMLDGQALTATVTDVNGRTYVYNAVFQPYVDQVIVDGIISGGIVDVNTAITANGDYAALGALDTATGTVNVLINNGSTQVTAVYSDIVQVLIDALNANKDKVASIAAGTYTIDLTGDAISAEDIKAFVKGSGLQGSGADGEILGSDPISVLVGQTLTATVTDVNDGEYTYNVTFQIVE